MTMSHLPWRRSSYGRIVFADGPVPTISTRLPGRVPSRTSTVRSGGTWCSYSHALRLRRPGGRSARVTAELAEPRIRRRTRRTIRRGSETVIGSPSCPGSPAGPEAEYLAGGDRAAARAVGRVDDEVRCRVDRVPVDRLVGGDDDDDVGRGEEIGQRRRRRLLAVAGAEGLDVRVVERDLGASRAEAGNHVGGRR